MLPGTKLGPIPDEIPRLVGELCTSWAGFEFETEQAIWGILGIDHKFGRLITWPKDLRQMWQLLLNEATSKHPVDEVEYLKKINNRLTDVMKDRNIVVHGLIQAFVTSPDAVQPNAIVNDAAIIVVPTWTVFKGEHAGKKFPVSAAAVRIISNNIEKLSNELVAFNNRHNYHRGYYSNLPVETDWPRPL
jgi:hypothetical protein